MGIRVLIAEDHTMVRQGLRALLDREGFDVVGEVSNGHEAVESSAEADPDVVVMDISMPVMNGIDAAQELSQRQPKAKAVLLTRHDDDQYVLAALRAGARGYVLKSQASADLFEAVRQVMRGEVYLPPSLALDARSWRVTPTDRGPMEPLGALSARERQVFELLVRGHTNASIGKLLGISAKTVDTHRTKVLRKIGVHSIVDLVRFAARNQLPLD